MAEAEAEAEAEATEEVEGTECDEGSQASLVDAQLRLLLETAERSDAAAAAEEEEEQQPVTRQVGVEPSVRGRSFVPCTCTASLTCSVPHNVLVSFNLR